MNETWTTVGENTHYIVSNRGRIARLLKPRPLPQGHLTVSLASGTGQRVKTALLHRIIAKAFHGNVPFRGAEVRHLNGRPADNRIENLKWGTRQENIADSIKHGVLPKGSKHHASKLTEKQASAIKRLLATKGFSHEVIAQSYDVSRATVSAIATGRNWAHVGS